MAQNTNPIFTQVPEIQWFTSGSSPAGGAITASNGGYSLASASAATHLVFTAGPSGSYVQRIRFKALGTNVATVARIFVLNTGSITQPSSSVLFDEVTLPATTAVANAATPLVELPLNFALPASHSIYVTLGIAVAAGYDATVIGGDY